VINDWAKTRAWAEELAEDAAGQALAMLGQGTVVHQKSDGTVVTDIDRAIERFLRSEIAARFPDHAILGEEYGYEGPQDVPLWALDPIDGTVNLANGLPHWGISVGLIADGEPVVGVASFPALGETYSAAKGLGATRNGEPLSQLPPGGPTTWEDAYAVCSTSVRAIDFADVPARIRVYGSAALECCWAAAGFAQGCQSIGVSVYDIAAGLCVGFEVGTRTAWLSGDAWSADAMARTGPRKDDVLLTAPPQTLEFLGSRLRWRDR
jgi:myo-inositol-1(or 4)-monophosphatase